MLRTTIYYLTVLFTIGIGNCYAQSTIYMDEMDISKIQQGWSVATANKNLRNKPITLGGKEYVHGVCTHAYSEAVVDLRKTTTRFQAIVGVEDINAGLTGLHDVICYIDADKKRIFTSDTLKAGKTQAKIDLNVSGYRYLELYIEGIGGDQHTHTSYADAKFTYTGIKPELIQYAPNNLAENQKRILTPKPTDKPKITGPKVFGVRPGSPILHRLTATGLKPLRFECTGLPKGVTLDPLTGSLAGSTTEKGSFEILVKVTNAKGEASRKFNLQVSDIIGLTPALGWNSWNCWGMDIDEAKVKTTADYLVSSGLADHGWSYVNIDDGWEGADRNHSSGELLTDPIKFPNMKSLADYVHGKGLKIGIYSSPGKLTCGRRLGSLQHEKIDAQTWAKWGIDYLKYDLCSYSDAIPIKGSNLYWAQKPYKVMREALRSTKRDIIYSMCQYGKNDVWKWGAQMDANSWRTTGDIIDTWASMKNIGFNQQESQPYSEPGHFNDPDMLVVGWVGWSSQLHPTRLNADEQFTHISLWAMLSSPLLLGCDLSKLDDFTVSLLTNDEVLDINQDPLAKGAKTIVQDQKKSVMTKQLEDGGLAVAIFNLQQEAQDFSIDLKSLGLTGKYTIRDLWRQKDIGQTSDLIKVKVNRHGLAFYKLVKA